MTPYQRDAACDAFNSLRASGKLTGDLLYQFVESNLTERNDRGQPVFNTRPGFEKAWRELGLELPNYTASCEYVFLWEPSEDAERPFRRPQLIELHEFLDMARGLPNPIVRWATPSQLKAS